MSSAALPSPAMARVFPSTRAVLPRHPHFVGRTLAEDRLRFVSLLVDGVRGRLLEGAAQRVAGCQLSLPKAAADALGWLHGGTYARAAAQLLQW